MSVCSYFTFLEEVGVGFLLMFHHKITRVAHVCGALTVTIEFMVFLGYFKNGLAYNVCISSSPVVVKIDPKSCKPSFVRTSFY